MGDARFGLDLDGVTHFMGDDGLLLSRRQSTYRYDAVEAVSWYYHSIRNRRIERLTSIIMWRATRGNHDQCNTPNDEQQDDTFADEAVPLKERSHNYGSSISQKSVRFQVVVWYVGPIDVVLGLVTMKFRVTIFWNAPTDKEHQAMSTTGYGNYDASNTKVWTMQGRQRAYQKALNEILPGSNLVYVPPVSILNAVDLDVVGEPEVCLVNEQKKVMKWTCMYKASLIQEHMQVMNFPHDEHCIVLRLGILKHRQPGRRWDRNRWRVSLATEEDSQGTIEVSYGLIVDHVKIPEFGFDKRGNDLVFEVVPLMYGPNSEDADEPDECLQIGLHVRRDSGYYDNNIVPLLAMLNIVGVSTLTLDPSEFGSRGEIILAIAFVSIGIRLTVDSKLPNVGYQIKMQRILNRFFYTLLFLHLESSLVYYLCERQGWNPFVTNMINTLTMMFATLYTAFLLCEYYFMGRRKQKFR